MPSSDHTSGPSSLLVPAVDSVFFARMCSARNCESFLARLVMLGSIQIVCGFLGYGIFDMAITPQTAVLHG